MHDRPESRTEKNKRERIERQAQELRANLKRRKTQARERADTPSQIETGAVAGDDAPPEQSGD